MSGPAKPHLFVFGLGYTALALARRLLGQGWRVSGTTRSAEKATALQAEGLEALPFDGEQRAAVSGVLSQASHLLASVPPDAEGDPVLRLYARDIAAARDLRWIAYLSTTAVYGDRGGGWVDETTPPAPTSERARRRLEAERAWLALAAEAGAPVQLFRLAGIYGPGRNPLEAVLTGRARRIVKPGQVFGRIHLEDILSALLASMQRPEAEAIYNLCDDEPADPAEVTAFAAALLGLPPPPAIPLEEAELSPAARSFYADNRRVSNRRMKQDLGVALAYPSYREGLRALLRHLPSS